MDPDGARVDANGEQQQSWRKYLSVQQLRVEPFILLYMFGYSLSAMAVSQLVQDKLCRVDYDQTAAFCISINSANFDHGAESIKSNIITSGAYITLYRTLLSTLPCIVWAVFLGPWSDTYVHGRKFIMIAGASAAALESFILIINAADFNASAYIVLFAFIPSALSGGIIATLMAIYAYCSATSDKTTRSTRFAIVEICFWIAQPIGSFIGGQILGNGNEKAFFQLYNYIPVFVVSFCSQIAGIIWVILVINENNNNGLSTSPSVDDNAPVPPSSSSGGIIIHPTTQFTGDHTNRSSTPVEADLMTTAADHSLTDHDQEYLIYSQSSYISLTRISYHSTKICQQFCRLFEVNNVRELFVTLTRKREHWGRGQIWLLFSVTALIMFTYMNTAFILWPYVEKLYSWPPKFYSTVTASATVGTLLLMGFVLPFFVRGLKLGDMRLAIIGIVSLLAQCTLRGSWQHEPGLYLSFIFGCLAPLSFIGVRSRLSKIIDDDERGKLFALLAIVEAVTPGIASVFYSMVFAVSIDIYPGLCFMLAAFILLVPLLAIIFIDVYCVHDYDAAAAASGAAAVASAATAGLSRQSPPQLT
ncbi:hypothetical protein TYRP_017920 [Tyrophagus putrescentiae]|nr:hypothetical protein TYRP_017920 [Tyrophagus putrescentiae]